MSIKELVKETGSLPTRAELESGLVLKLFRTKAAHSDFVTAYWIMVGDVEDELYSITTGRTQAEADEKMKKKILG